MHCIRRCLPDKSYHVSLTILRHWKTLSACWEACMYALAHTQHIRTGMSCASHTYKHAPVAAMRCGNIFTVSFISICDVQTDTSHTHHHIAAITLITRSGERLAVAAMVCITSIVSWTPYVAVVFYSCWFRLDYISRRLFFNRIQSQSKNHSEFWTWATINKNKLVKNK